MTGRICYDHNPPHAVGTLVCLPGVNSGPYLFEGAVAEMGRQWRVVRMNVPGVEGVPLIPPFTAASYARHVWGVLDGMGVKEHIVVLGHSMGGFAAQEMAHQRPEAVERLILVSTSRGQPDMTSDLAAMQRTLGRSFWQMGKEIDAHPHKAMQPLFGPGFVNNHYDAYVRFIDDRQRMLPPVSIRLAHLSAGGMFSSLAWLRSIRCPTLVVHGGHDILVRAQSGRRLAEGIAGARWLELYGVGHFPMLEHGQFWQYVKDFIGGAALGIEAVKPVHPWVQRFKDFLFRHG